MKHIYRNSLDIFDFSRAVIRLVGDEDDRVICSVDGVRMLHGAGQSISEDVIRRAVITFDGLKVDGFAGDDPNEITFSAYTKSVTGNDAAKRLRAAIGQSAMVLSLADFCRDVRFHVTADMCGAEPLFTADLSFDSVSVEWED